MQTAHLYSLHICEHPHRVHAGTLLEPNSHRCPGELIEGTHKAETNRKHAHVDYLWGNWGGGEPKPGKGTQAISQVLEEGEEGREEEPFGFTLLTSWPWPTFPPVNPKGEKKAKLHDSQNCRRVHTDLPLGILQFPTHRLF